MKDKEKIETRYWRTSSGTGQACLEEAAAALAAGGIVAFPTETVYGLGADARNTEAVARIFAAKGRPSDNPLIVHLASEDALDALVERVNDTERKLIRACWPGPLTLVLPVRAGVVSPLVTAGLDTVAVRVPAHEVARQLIAMSGCPLAAPSANRSGRPSPTEATHVLEDLSGRIDGVVDGGETGIGLESTVVRVVGDAIHILRPGGVTCEQLQQIAGPGMRVVADGGEPTEDVRGLDAGVGSSEDVCGLDAGSGSSEDVRGLDANGGSSEDVRGLDANGGASEDFRGLDASGEPEYVAELALHVSDDRANESGAVPGTSGRRLVRWAESGAVEGEELAAATPPDDDRPRSPGVKYKHYAPQGAMLLVVGSDPERLVAAVCEAADEARCAGRRVGILASSEHADRYAGFADEVLVCGSRQEPAEAARRLYALLRECDHLSLDAIFAEGFPEAGIGAALMNRMRKAAGGRVRKV